MLSSVVFTEKLDALWRRVGIMVAVIAALAMGVGIADFVYTYVSVPLCTSAPSTDICIWTYICAGVWGAIAVCVTTHHKTYRTLFYLFYRFLLISESAL